MSTRVLKTTTLQEASKAAAEGASVIRAGGLVGFATETVYGIAALAADAVAMARLRELKSRPQRPFSVHISRPEEIFCYAADVSDSARRLMARAMPGPVTLLLPVEEALADQKLQDARLYERLVEIKPGRRGAKSQAIIGLRCPDQPLAQEMLRQVPGPVVAPSANLAGKPSPRTAQDVLEALDGQIDLLIDSGPTRYGKDSTIVDFSLEPWQIVREGVYDERMIRRFMHRTYLFVCSGNTCRSPMAAGLAGQIIARLLGVGPKELARKDVEVLSAGVFATSGAEATIEAIAAAADLGADIAAHRSRKLTNQLIRDADMIFCMTQSHVEQVLALEPQARPRVVRLDETGDITDPIGGGVETYRRTARQIEAALRRRFEKGLP